jgi:hypothetical protein
LFSFRKQIRGLVQGRATISILGCCRDLQI